MTEIDFIAMMVREVLSEEITVKQKIEWSKKTKVTASTKGNLRGDKEPSVYGIKNYGFHKCTEKPLEDFE